MPLDHVDDSQCMIRLCSRTLMISCGYLIGIHLPLGKTEGHHKSALHSEFGITHLLLLLLQPSVQ